MYSLAGSWSGVCELFQLERTSCLHCTTCSSSIVEACVKVCTDWNLWQDLPAVHTSRYTCTPLPLHNAKRHFSAKIDCMNYIHTYIADREKSFAVTEATCWARLCLCDRRERSDCWMEDHQSDVEAHLAERPAEFESSGRYSCWTTDWSQGEWCMWLDWRLMQCSHHIIGLLYLHCFDVGLGWSFYTFKMDVDSTPKYGFPIALMWFHANVCTYM